MKYDCFSTPFFVNEVDLEKIYFINDFEYKSTFESKIKTNLNTKASLSEESLRYLSCIFDKNLKQLGYYENGRILDAWRNVYDQSDWQGVHIHPESQFSFVIYESVKKSNIVFLNPAWKLMELSDNYKNILNKTIEPNLKTGDLVMFPSFIEHYVEPGNEGTTIAGNISADFIHQSDNIT